MSSAANKARLLPVSFPHAASWLSVTPSEVLGLHLNPSQSLSGGLAWTFPMVLAAHCALRLSWSLLAIMLLPAKGVVMWFLATIDYMMSLQCPVCVVAVTPNHSHTCSADLWFQIGFWASQQLSTCRSHPHLIPQLIWKLV